MCSFSAGWVNRVLENGTLGLWQAEQGGGKWLRGGLWHALHVVEDECLNVHETPVRWHVEHLDDLPAWLLGRL